MSPEAAEDSEEPLLLSIAVADAALHDRLASLLSEVPGLRIVPAGEPADATVGDAKADGVTTDGARIGSRVPEGSPELTPRELEVLDILAEGASNREIAERLGISVHTAKFHVGSILDKLDSSGRTDAVAYALRVGVLRL